jgi:hypothetical protein
MGHTTVPVIMSPRKPIRLERRYGRTFIVHTLSEAVSIIYKLFDRPIFHRLAIYRQTTTGRSPLSMPSSWKRDYQDAEAGSEGNDVLLVS